MGVNWHGVELELALVSPFDIHIDKTYQREARADRIKSISEDYSPLKFEAARVNRREDGTLWAVNCQHRIRVAQLKGEQQIPAVISNAPKEVEANMFIGSNNTRALAHYDQHKAKLVLGDTDAIQLQEDVELFGFYVVSHGRGKNDPNAIGAINTLYLLGEWGVRKQVLSVLREVWKTDSRRTSGEFIKGLGITYRDFLVDDTRLIEVLAQNGFGEVKEMANAIAKTEGSDSHGGGGSRRTTWSLAIQKLYRKGRQRLEPRPSS